MASESELAGIRNRLSGMVDDERIKAVEFPRAEQSIRKRFMQLTDATSLVSDVLEELGIGGSVPAHILAPISEGQKVVGPALTIRYGPRGGSPGSHYARSSRTLLASRDFYGIGRSGDVAVFDCGGDASTSVMGGFSARWAQHLEIAGCIIDGGARDIDSIRQLKFPVWSAGRTPLTGLYRLEALEINGPVRISKVTVRPGDLVVADGAGVCIVPYSHISQVLTKCEEAGKKDAEAVGKVGAGVPPRR